MLLLARYARSAAIKQSSENSFFLANLYIVGIRLIPNLSVLLCHIQSKVARKSRFDGEQICQLAFIFLICFGGGRDHDRGRVLGILLFLISPSWFRP